MNRSRLQKFVFADGYVQLTASLLGVTTSSVLMIFEDATHDEFFDGVGVVFGVVSIAVAFALGALLLKLVKAVGRGSRSAVVVFTVLQGSLTLITLVCVMYSVHPAYLIVFPIFLATTVLSAMLLTSMPRRTSTPSELVSRPG